MRLPKSFQASYDHAIVLVRKLTTCTTLYKQTEWSRDALSVRKWQFYVKHDFENRCKINIFTSKLVENGFEDLPKRKNRHLRTLVAIEID